MRLFYTFILILTTWICGISQSPVVHCVSVAANGNVTVNWSPTTNLASVFVQYNIYSNASGSFAQEGTSTVLGSTVFIHAGANANVAPVSYYVTVVYDNGTANVELPPLDTLTSIYLNVSNPSNGTATMVWNDLSSPIDPDNGDYYYIQREYPAGVWTLYDSVLISDPNCYRDTISICSANINYQVYLNNSQGCQSLSSIDGDLFEDLIPPDPPDFTGITVDSLTGNAVLNWSPSASPDASGYIVLQYLGGGWTILDTVYGYNNTTYTNTNSNADLIGESYVLAAFDSCWSGVPSAPNTSPVGIDHKTIFLKNTYDVCAKEISLKWNQYINWSSGVGAYEVFRSVEGGAYALVTSQTSGDTAFVDDALNYQTNYCYLIRAVSGDAQDTVISNISCRFTRQAPSPSYAYVQAVSVEENTLEIRLHPDLAGITKEIIVQKSEDQGITFETIYTTTSVSAIITVEDKDLDVNSETAEYRYVVLDSCGNEILTSNVSGNILLTVDADAGSMINFLQWTPYKNWNGNLLRYDIYRSVNGVFQTAPLVSVPSSQYYYEDDISLLIGSDANGQFCYYVEAVESVNVYGINETSSSNEVCVTQPSLVYIPNALVVGGVNSSWRPVVNLIDFSSFETKIFNRLGQIIFTSNYPEDTWNGTHKGSTVPLGVYVYEVSFYSGEGKFHDYWGTITLVK